MWIPSLPKQQQSVPATHLQDSANTMYLPWWCNILSTDKKWNDKESGSFLWPLHWLKYFLHFITNRICICPLSSGVMKTEAKICKYIKPKCLKLYVTHYVPFNPNGINNSKNVCTQLLSEPTLQQTACATQGHYKGTTGSVLCHGMVCYLSSIVWDYRASTIYRHLIHNGV